LAPIRGLSTLADNTNTPPPSSSTPPSSPPPPPLLVPASILIRYCPIRAPPARALSCASAASVQTGSKSDRELRLLYCFKTRHSQPRGRFTPDSLAQNGDIVESCRFGEFLWRIPRLLSLMSVALF